jgi:hypothetical protein
MTTSIPDDPGFNVTFGFPVWEILATLILTSVVTAVTIRVSLRSSRSETERVLQADRLAGRGAAIAALVGAFRMIVDQGREDAFYDPAIYPGWSIGTSALRLTRSPYAEEVIEWIDQMAWFFEFHGKNELGFLNTDDLLTAEANPVLYVAERLARWDADPESEGKAFLDELPELRSRHWWVQ